eukprot:528732-Pelagomonas_calceolata.AAC.1
MLPFVPKSEGKSLTLAIRPHFNKERPQSGPTVTGRAQTSPCDSYPLNLWRKACSAQDVTRNANAIGSMEVH